MIKKQIRNGRGITKKQCSKCNKIKEKDNKRYCLKCASNYMQIWRKTHKLTKEQKIKANIRSHTKMKIKRGMLIKLPCEICDDKNVEAHHPDYNKPDKVIFLCKKHHLMIHGR